MSHNFKEAVLRELYELLTPLGVAARNEVARGELVAGIGWDLDAIAGFPVEELCAQLAQLGEARDYLARVAEETPDSLAEVLEGLATSRKTFDALRRLHTILSSAGIPTPRNFERFGEDLATQMTASYLRVVHPAVFHLGRLLTLIRAPEDLAPPARLSDPQGVVIRYPYHRTEFRLERVGELLKDPLKVLGDEYFPAGLPSSSAAALEASDRLFPRLALFFNALGMNVCYGFDPGDGYDFGAFGNEAMARMLLVQLPEDGDGVTAGATLYIDAPDGTNLGVVVAPFGALSLTRAQGDWEFTLALTAGVEAFAVGPRGFVLRASTDAASVEGELTQTYARAGEPALVFGGAAGTRLEVGRLEFAEHFSLSASARSLGVSARARGSAFVLAPGESDGFLRALMPGDGLRFEFDLGLGWDGARGFYIEGGGDGLEQTLPVGKTFLDVLTVESLYLLLKPSDAGLLLQAATTLTARLGPAAVTLERVGLEAVVGFSNEAAGNLGLLDVALGFKPPGGAAVSIDTDLVSGGGFISWDAENGQYAGVIQLEINKRLTLRAVALLTTRMPDGSEGFSFLVVISAEGFPPVQLGYGFSLVGVGGLVGINRAGSVEELRAAFRTGRLDALLKPPDPASGASQYVSDLQHVFPVAADRHVFGPRFVIAWGAPRPVFQLDLALLLELPSPVRLLATGRLGVGFPSLETEARLRVVDIKMDALGVVDLDRGEASLDAQLIDSRLAGFPVTGGAALRAAWGEAPCFLLSAGGFHPAFRPPADFPPLKRLSLSLPDVEGYDLRLESYFALTANTAQFGSRLFVSAEVVGYRLRGEFGFDTLFQFDPFRFAAHVDGFAEVRSNSEPVGCARLSLNIDGPTPWRIKGTLEVESPVPYSCDVSLVFGDSQSKQSLPAAAPVNLRSLLISAVREPLSWSGQLPAGGHSPVTLGAVEPPPGLMLHPLGELTLSQRVLPLKVEVNQFGSASLPAPEYLALGVGVAGLALTASAVRDDFAPSQFFRMSDAEKLSRPSFESLESGVRLASAESVSSPPYEESFDAGSEFETVIIDPNLPQPREVFKTAVKASVQSGLSAHGAAARAPLNDAGSAKYKGGGQRVTTAETNYLIATAEDLKPTQIGGIDPKQGVAYARADDALRLYLSEHPGEGGRYTLAGVHEVSA
ncbi:MAG TPA: DUF6603 domain-containing protein [Pyrinomonadaceae bacterium]